MFPSHGAKRRSAGKLAYSQKSSLCLGFCFSYALEMSPLVMMAFSVSVPQHKDYTNHL